MDENFEKMQNLNYVILYCAYLLIFYVKYVITSNIKASNDC